MFDRYDLVIAALIVFVVIDGAYKISEMYTPGYAVEQVGPSPPYCAKCAAGIQAHAMRVQ